MMISSDSEHTVEAFRKCWQGAVDLGCRRLGVLPPLVASRGFARREELRF